MEATDEQKEIVQAKECDLTLIQAYAGTGKTTTLLMIAAHKPPEKRILYVCFGKENQLETERRFQSLGSRVKATTFDGFAYRYFNESRSPASLTKWVISRELKISIAKAEDVSNEFKRYAEDLQYTEKVPIKTRELWDMLCTQKTFMWFLMFSSVFSFKSSIYPFGYC